MSNMSDMKYMKKDFAQQDNSITASPQKRGMTTNFTRIVIIFSIFMLTVNILLGASLMVQASHALKEQINARMLDVANAAANLVDGDMLKTLTAEDEKTLKYQRELAILRSFQDSVELAYIYGIKDMGDGTFTFTIDPTVNDPGKFGEPIVYTEALYKASRGVPSVDEVAYEDKWGKFYSAYSPVFDSGGNVAGIIAVDFRADWYDHQIKRNMIMVGVLSILFMLAGATIVYMITANLRRRFAQLNQDAQKLSDDMNTLAQQLQLATGKTWDFSGVDRNASGKNDLIEEMDGRIQVIRTEVKEYIEDVHTMAYTDKLTGVGNRTAYYDRVESLEQLITEKGLCFSVGVFDLNGLKKANDDHGHEYGDRLIIDAADALCAVFGKENIYRIGGDEFVTILENVEETEMREKLQALDTEIENVNERRREPMSIAKGAAGLDERDWKFNDIFNRADKAMYEDKAAYYKQHERRKR